MATYAICDRVLVDTAGNVVSSAQIEVRLLPGATLATIYSGRSGGAKTNPIVLTASDAGRVKFHAAGGAYRLTNLLTGDVWDYVAIGTGAEVDSDAFVLSSQIREKLTANRTYYVRTDGSDSNTGLANTAGGAFLTIQKAVDVVTDTLDLAGYTVTIQVAAGTYTGGVLMTRPARGGTLKITGDTTTPANVIISKTSGNAVETRYTGVSLTVEGLKLTTTTSGDCLCANYASQIIVSGKMDFGASPGAHIHSVYGGFVDVSGVAYNITAAALYHFWTETFGASIRAIGAVTVTITGSPAFSIFANAQLGSGIIGVSVTYSGTATGKRFNVDDNGVINVFGGGINYFPGNSAGTAITGGGYRP